MRTSYILHNLSVKLGAFYKKYFSVPNSLDGQCHENWTFANRMLKLSTLTWYTGSTVLDDN